MKINFVILSKIKIFGMNPEILKEIYTTKMSTCPFPIWNGSSEMAVSQQEN